MSVAAGPRGLAAWRLIGSWDAVRREAAGGPGLMIRIAYLEMVGLALLYATGALSVLMGDTPFSPAQVAEAVRRGPAIGGLLVAAVGWAGLRSGSRGGPLSIEAPFVSLALLSPASRRALLMRGAIRHLATSLGLGAFFGAAAGIAISLRMRGSPFEFALSAGAAGALAACVYSGSALIACGTRTNSRTANVIGLAAALVAALALTTNLPLWPFAAAASLALAPAGAQVSSIELVLPAVLVVAGLLRLGSADPERLRKRSELTSLIGFATANENFRQAWSAYRRLAGENPSRRPLVRLSGKHLQSVPVVRRDLQSALRWPPVRLVRILGLAAGVVLAVAAASSTFVLLGAAGLAATLLALECSEGLGQDADHPQMWETLPVSACRMLIEHLLLPTVAIVAAGAVALAGLAFWLGPGVLAHAWVGLLGVAAAVAMAAVSINASRSSVLESPQLMQMVATDSTGIMTLGLFGFRYLGPPIVVAVSLAPAVVPLRLGLPLAALAIIVAGAALGRRLWKVR